MKRSLLLLISCLTIFGLRAQDSVNITFHVNMANETVDPAGVYIAGGAQFGAPGDNRLSDPDNDGIYSITVRKPKFTSDFYIFTNGACANFSCKESLAGKPCGDPNNFNDRSFPSVTQDTVISTCFAQCTDTTACAAAPGNVDVTFRVDMFEQTVSGAGVFLGASFDGWSGGLEMLDPDGDQVYEFTVNLPPGNYQYKFINGANFSNPEIITAGSPCVGGGATPNRLLTVAGTSNVILDAFCYESCNECAPRYNVTFQVDMSEQTVASTGVFVGGKFEGWAGNVELTDPDNDNIYTVTLPLVADSYQFKYINGSGFSNPEVLDSMDVACTSTSNGNTNRVILVDTADIVLDASCFGRCETCDGNPPPPNDTVSVTFNVNMKGQTLNQSGVYIAAGSAEHGFGLPGDNRMLDPDGDTIYSITFRRHKKDATHYRFTNGLCLDFSCQEELVGLECGDPNNFNNRFLPVLGGDTTITVCFAKCTTGCEAATGLGDLLKDNDFFTLSPVPANDLTRLSFSGNELNSKELSIIDLSGKEILTQVIGARTDWMEIPTADWAPGIYFVVVKVGQKIGTQKLVVRH